MSRKYKTKIFGLVIVLVCNLILGTQVLFAGDMTFDQGLNNAGVEAGFVEELGSGDGTITTTEGLRLPSERGFSFLVGRALRLLYPLLAVVYVILVIYAGVLWTASKGQPDGIKRARGLIVHSSIGVGMAYLAAGVVAYILKMAGSIEGLGK